MKKALALVLLVLVGVLIFLRLPKSENNQKILSPLSKASVRPSSTESLHTTLLVVPYWGLGTTQLENKNYDGRVYFAIRPNAYGIDTEDLGYKKISQFLQTSNTKTKKYLAISFLDSSINFKVLENKNLQKKVIAQTIDLAKQYSFNGIMLDLEVSSLPFDSVIQEINNFTHDFYATSKDNKLSFYTALYGDVFYRLRPYDVSVVAQHADRILVMAYDFHKTKGNPGPNFPLSGRETYGYDFKKMMEDYLKVVEREKITIMFGMFGYDWTIDEKNQPIKHGEAVSLSDIKSKYIDKCIILDCAINRDEMSGEPHIEYTDKNNNKHVVWYEDMESVAKKKKYLNSIGIDSTAFWAYSYF